VIAYASVTASGRNLVALRAHDWRLLVVASSHDWRTNGFAYAIDNGAWAAHKRGEPWDDERFLQILTELGAGADWVVLPDIVAGGAASLARSLHWRDLVLGLTPRALLAVQDGMTPEDVRPHLGPRVGIFVGGSTEWKLQTLAQWSHLGREAGTWVHVGRVNTARRIKLCVQAGATSFDGTSASMYAVNVPKLDNQRRQLALMEPSTP
jgi:hypothetical protein